MYISKYEIKIKDHVFERAVERGIDPDMIENAMLKGRLERFGKHGVKFINEGDKRTIILIGELIGTKLKIIIIEEGN